MAARKNLTRGKMRKSAQLPLDLPVKPRFGAEDFLVSTCNESAYTMLENQASWPGGMLVLVGPEGSGKSHLSAIWAERNNAPVVQASSVVPEHVDSVLQRKALAVEGIDASSVDEAALFHLVNRAAERGKPLLFSSRTSIGSLAFQTPDLQSRFRRMPSVEIAPPDDELLRALVVKLLLDRQMMVDTSVVAFLCLRSERSFEGIRHMVERLDRESLAQGRRLTRPVAAAILGLSND
jgi:chromosomal replication initiation ATPase DnaA